MKVMGIEEWSDHKTVVLLASDRTAVAIDVTTHEDAMAIVDAVSARTGAHVRRARVQPIGTGGGTRTTTGPAPRETYEHV